jgi:hypothetical protein
MLDSNIILNTEYNLQYTGAYLHGILTQEWESWPCGTPIIYPDKDIRIERNTTRVATLITPSQGSSGSVRSDVYNYLIKPVGLRPLYNNHKVITTSRFDLNKFNRLREFVRDVGGISIIVEYSEGKKSLAMDVRGLCRKFNYGSMFYWNANAKHMLDGPDDKHICIVSIFDLPYCIPIFNVRKVDGIGLSVVGTTVATCLKNRRLVPAFATDLICSNYKDNVFVVDGARINTANRNIKDSLFEEMNRFACVELLVRKPGIKLKKAFPTKKRSISDMKRQESNHKQMAYGGPVKDHANYAESVYKGGYSSSPSMKFQTAGDGVLPENEAQAMLNTVPSLVVNTEAHISDQITVDFNTVEATHDPQDPDENDLPVPADPSEEVETPTDDEEMTEETSEPISEPETPEQPSGEHNHDGTVTYSSNAGGSYYYSTSTWGSGSND